MTHEEGELDPPSPPPEERGVTDAQGEEEGVDPPPPLLPPPPPERGWDWGSQTQLEEHLSPCEAASPCTCVWPWRS